MEIDEYEHAVTPEQYENVLKRIFTRGYTIEHYRDGTEDMFTGRLGYVYGIEAFYVDEPILEVIWGDYDYIVVNCFWDDFNPELIEIQEFLDEIITKEVPGMKLDRKTKAPRSYNKNVHKCIHRFRYIFPEDKKDKKA